MPTGSQFFAPGERDEEVPGESYNGLETPFEHIQRFRTANEE